MSDITDDEIEAARRRGEESMRTEPHAAAARYDEPTGTLIIELRKGATVIIPIQLLAEVRGATARQLAEAKPTRFGNAIEFEEIDMRISVKGLMRDFVGLTAPDPLER